LAAQREWPARSPRRRSLRGDDALAHGDVVAETAARARHVGERVAERIRALSGGRLDITVSAAGEVVPAFEVLDAVGGGVAEMGHTAAFYWQGKDPAAAFFTTVPFGLTPGEHVAWVDAGGGRRCGTSSTRRSA
jgi:TRAP-type mannitol/chloroaromatic compound transport system substrate-binding protein